MGAWVIGHNLSGYLPESDTEAYETREEAAEAFAIMARDYADTDDKHAWDVLTTTTPESDVADDDHPTMLATVSAILKDDGPNVPDLASKDYGMHVEDSAGRLIYFWMQYEPTRDPYTDDVGTPLD